MQQYAKTQHAQLRHVRHCIAVHVRLCMTDGALSCIPAIFDLSYGATTAGKNMQYA